MMKKGRAGVLARRLPWENFGGAGLRACRDEGRPGTAAPPKCSPAEIFLTVNPRTRNSPKNTASPLAQASRLCVVKEPSCLQPEKHFPLEQFNFEP